jgi:hypothetical protein
MNPSLNVFLDFSLPNATTWFYFSWLLAVALFFKFSRLLSIRNWDVVTMFLLVPGLLVIQASRVSPALSPNHPAIQIMDLVGQEAGMAYGAPTGLAWFGHPNRHPAIASTGGLWWGYLWLMCGSAYFFLRCLLDLTLVGRPALPPNLDFGGLFWLGGALYVCLVTVAFRVPDRLAPRPATDSVGIHSTAATPVPTPVVPSTVGPESASLGQLRHWLSRTLAVLGHLAVVLGLIFIGRWHFQDVTGGMAAATFYLMLPYTGLYVGQAHHVWPMALVIWALATSKLPILAGAFLGLAAGTMYFPAVLLPLWLSLYWKRGAGRFLAAFLATAGLCLAVIGLVLWLQNDLDTSIREALGQTAWQPWKIPTTEGFWTGTHWAYRIPIFVAYVAFVLVTAFWPWPKNLAHLIALSAAVLIGIQFWYADQGGVYVLWYLPLLLLLVFRPNLADHRPALIHPETDWLCRLRRATTRLVRRLLKIPEMVRAR